MFLYLYYFPYPVPSLSLYYCGYWSYINSYILHSCSPVMYQYSGYIMKNTRSNIDMLNTELTRRSSAKKHFYQNKTQFQPQATKGARTHMLMWRLWFPTCSLNNIKQHVAWKLRLYRFQRYMCHPCTTNAHRTKKKTWRGNWRTFRETLTHAYALYGERTFRETATLQAK